MSIVDYLSDLSQHLGTGEFSDLTLRFHGASFKIHKYIASAHSKWFHRALTIGLQETKSGVITLEDDAEFGDAIAAMVTYFYSAGYNASEYATNEAMLHAQVSIIADKYDCTSLLKPSNALFSTAIATVDAEVWMAVADFVYNHTSSEVPNHRFLRSHIVSSMKNRPSFMNEALETEAIEQLLRGSADLATDLLISGKDHLDAKTGCRSVFLCRNCKYTHVGSLECTELMGKMGRLGLCPDCHNAKKYLMEVPLYIGQNSCPSCEGVQT